MDKKTKGELFQVPGMIAKVETMAKALKVIVYTQETITDEQSMLLMKLKRDESVGWFTFLVRKKTKEDDPEKIILKDVENLPELDDIKEFKDQKTSTQRLYNTLLAYFKNETGSFDGFQAWRTKEMDKIMQWYKDRLPDKLN